MTDIVVPEYLPPAFVDRLAERHDVLYDPDLYARRAELFDQVADARAVLIRNRTTIDAGFLEHARLLVVVGRLGVGLDNIDMAAADAAGVEVVPAVGGNAVSVAEYVIGAMLVLSRGTFGMTESMIRGEWPRQGHAFGHELFAKCLGLIGLGSIARHVAKRAAGFGMRIIAHDPFLADDDTAWETVESVPLDHLMATADVISLHVPLDAGTRGLIDGTAISRMKPNATVINTSRGGIVDERALADALRSNRIRAAALDVFASEPLGPDHGAVFAGLTNVLLSPHVAGNTRESVDRIAETIVDAVLRRLEGT